MKTVKLFCAVALLTGVATAAPGRQPSEDEDQQPSRDQIRAAVQAICPVRDTYPSPGAVSDGPGLPWTSDTSSFIVPNARLGRR